MPSEFVANTPIYLQILQGIRQKIASGQWPPGMRIPPVRELALELGVNPNTTQRSLIELERQGLVYAERTSGRFITGDTALIARLQSQMALEYTKEFYGQMRGLGFQLEDIIQSVQQTAATEEGNHHELPDQL